MTIPAPPSPDVTLAFTAALLAIVWLRTALRGPA